MLNVVKSTFPLDQCVVSIDRIIIVLGVGRNGDVGLEGKGAHFRLHFRLVFCRESVFGQFASDYELKKAEMITRRKMWWKESVAVRCGGCDTSG